MLEMTRKQRQAHAATCNALIVKYVPFADDAAYRDAVEKLMQTTRHLRRGEMGLEVTVGNNSDALQIAIDGPSALVEEFIGFVYDAGFNVKTVMPTQSVMALAA